MALHRKCEMGCFCRNTLALTSSRGFEPTDVPGEFRFRLRAHARITQPTADWTADKEIGEFRRMGHFASYEVTERHYNAAPPYYEYTIRFSRG
jgi:hypothetical protein